MARPRKPRRSARRWKSAGELPNVVTLNSFSCGGGTKNGATKQAAKISEKMSLAGELPDIGTDAATLSSFMDGGGDFKKAEKAFVRLKSAKLVPPESSTTRSRTWFGYLSGGSLQPPQAPAKAGVQPRGFESGAPSAAPSFIDGAAIFCFRRFLFIAVLYIPPAVRRPGVVTLPYGGGLALDNGDSA